MEGYKNCPYCGQQINIAAKKCFHCGKWLTTDAATPNNVQPQQQPQPEIPPQPAQQQPTFNEQVSGFGNEAKQTFGDMGNQFRDTAGDISREKASLMNILFKALKITLNNIIGVAAMALTAYILLLIFFLLTTRGSLTGVAMGSSIPMLLLVTGFGFSLFEMVRVCAALPTDTTNAQGSVPNKLAIAAIYVALFSVFTLLVALHAWVLAAVGFVGGFLCILFFSIFIAIIAALGGAIRQQYGRHHHHA